MKSKSSANISTVKFTNYYFENELLSLRFEKKDTYFKLNVVRREVVCLMRLSQEVTLRSDIIVVVVLLQRSSDFMQRSQQQFLRTTNRLNNYFLTKLLKLI